jgi:CRP-like cAMP-binding protein
MTPIAHPDQRIVDAIQRIPHPDFAPEDALLGRDDAFIELNRILRGLPFNQFDQIDQELEPVYLRTGQVLSVAEEPIRYVYFPRDAVIVVLAVMNDGTTIESATTGNEGLVGVEVSLGDGLALAEVLVQIPGAALRMSADPFRRAVDSNPLLRAMVYRYTLALMNQIARTAGCSRLHSITERCARWLLMSADRFGRELLPVTHEALAALLGARRASVTESLGVLQRDGIIRYNRGHIIILDRQRLEAAACEDYRLSRQAYDRLESNSIMPAS